MGVLQTHAFLKLVTIEKKNHAKSQDKIFLKTTDTIKRYKLLLKGFILLPSYYISTVSFRSLHQGGSHSHLSLSLCAPVCRHHSMHSSTISLPPVLFHIISSCHRWSSSHINPSNLSTYNIHVKSLLCILSTINYQCVILSKCNKHGICKFLNI